MSKEKENIKVVKAGNSYTVSIGNITISELERGYIEKLNNAINIALNEEKETENSGTVMTWNPRSGRHEFPNNRK